VDLNELFSRHQIALIRADRTETSSEHRRYAAQADCFASRLGALQQHLGARTPPLAAARGRLSP